MKTIIIEDELRTARELKRILEKISPGIVVLSILQSVEGAIKWLRENELPDLIFADVQLGDGNSFDIFKKIEIHAPIIFCTAFDEYAVKAFELNSIDYLLKPLDENAVKRSVEKYTGIKKFYSMDTPSPFNHLSKVITRLERNYKKSILVHYRDKITPVKIHDIAFVYSSGGLVMLYTIEGVTHNIQQNIDGLEKLLDPEQFFRANRQFLINRDCVSDVEHFFNRRLAIKTQVQPPEEIVVSKLKAQDFLDWIEG